MTGLVLAPAGTAVRLDVAPRSAAGAFARRGEPVAAGVPLAKGVLGSPDQAQLVDAEGRTSRAQMSAVERWSDGSVRWLLVRLNATTDARGRASYRLLPSRAAPDIPGDRLPPIRIDARPDAIAIDTGPIAATIANEVELTARGGAPSRMAVELVDGREIPMIVRFTRRDLDDAGPLYARVHLAGSASTRDGSSALDVSLRLEFFAGLPVVRCAIALTNPRRATHPGGIWELGDPASVWIRDAAVSVRLPEGDTRTLVRYSVEPQKCWQTTGGDLSIYQESSGGRAWSSRNHVNRDGIVPLRFQGYEVASGRRTTGGLRATPIVQLVGTAASIAIATEHYWENFPKRIRVMGDAVSFDMFPGCAADIAELQPGERKTHAFTVALGEDPVTDEPLAWVRAPLLLAAQPAEYLAAEPLPFLSAPGDDPAGDAFVRGAIEGPHSFFQKREEIDEYGWRHFGDIYADHEAVGSPTLISHYNNQYDAIAGFAAQYFRSADARWWTLMDDLASHVADIDMYHAIADKSAYSGGLFWHTSHYVDAGRSTHRSYPSDPRVGGGGPSAEHNYSTGLMIHYLLTGSPFSRDAAIGLAEWVIAMDEGAATPFKWLARGATGLASATASYAFHGPGRGAGNSIAVLLNGHRLTGDRRFLAKAEELIARCIGPADDIAALNLLDAESRWSYTVFLQALGRYLFHKAERGEIDAAYAHARASLVHYVRWMADHEYPYLDNAAILEYPTETWPAQDLRKAEVFVLGALATEGDEQSALLERAAYFRERSLVKLQRMGTAWLTRPAVILLSTLGAVPWWRRCGRSHLLPRTEAQPAPRRAAFVPQRARAMRRARVVASFLVVAVLAAAAALLLAG